LHVAIHYSPRDAHCTCSVPSTLPLCEGISFFQTLTGFQPFLVVFCDRRLTTNHLENFPFEFNFAHGRNAANLFRVPTGKFFKSGNRWLRRNSTPAHQGQSLTGPSTKGCVSPGTLILMLHFSLPNLQVAKSRKCK
jgi:hypothetical protein